MGVRALPLYEKALHHIARAAPKRRAQGVYYSWFSDTFIIDPAAAVPDFRDFHQWVISGDVDLMTPDAKA